MPDRVRTDGPRRGGRFCTPHTMLLPSLPRSGGLLPPHVQHAALRPLQHPPSVPVRPEERQVLLAGERRTVAYDAALGGGDPPVHQPLRRVRGPRASRGCAQSGPVCPAVSADLEEPLDWVLFPDGEPLHARRP